MEFSDLKIDKNQEEEDDVDLLDMMDNWGEQPFWEWT